jgi:hypothetical protein
MKSEGPKQSVSKSTYAALAVEAVENPDEWFEQEIQGISPANVFAYTLASLLCEMKQRDGIFYVRYHGLDKQASNTEVQP